MTILRRCDIYTHTHSGILAIKKNEILPFAVTWMNLEIILSKSDLERQMYDITYKWNLKYDTWNSHHGPVETDPTRNHEVAGLTPGLPQWVKDLALP